jgi:hypothetical protein
MVLEEKWRAEAGEGLEINKDLSNFWTRFSFSAREF